MSDSSKAVFLSYASQDAEAARRLCEALRAAGVEVWFDQSELVGGDAWDQKIRRQIRECALLIPIISQATQGRREAYFRLEWKLAEERTHLMARGTPFLLPVTIDETGDRNALVPDSFLAVQWTKAPGGEASAAFCQRVKKLLGEEQPAVGGGLSRDDPQGSRHEAAHPGNAPRWLRPVLASAVLVIIVLAFTLMKKGAGANSTRVEAGANPPAAHGNSRPEVEALLKRVRATTAKTDALRTELDSMESLLGQATKLDPADASVWAAWAMLDCRYVEKNYDLTQSRLDAARSHSAQATGLDPEAPEVRLAQAKVMHVLGKDDATNAAATRILQRLLGESPADGRILMELGSLAYDGKNPEVALDWYDRAARLPGLGGLAHFAKAKALYHLGRVVDVNPELDRSLEFERSAEVLLWKSYILTVWNGDLAGARKSLDEVPPQYFVEDMPAITRSYIDTLSQDYDRALAAVRNVPHDYLQSVAFSGPKGFFAGNILALQGKKEAARLEWQGALATVERRLATESNDRILMEFKALLQADLGDLAAGQKTFQTVQELYGDVDYQMQDYLHLQLLPAAEAIAWVEKKMAAGPPDISAAALRLDPVYNPIRSDPGFAALLARAEADPRLSPVAKSRPAEAVREIDGKSVAVLAFTNLSEDKGNEYFSDGISEELLNVLAKIPELKVAARTSAFYFKGKEVPIPEIARQLGVAYVVEGSVRKSGDRVRITAQLIKAADGFHVWSDTFTRDLKDIFGVQDEIAGLIAKNLELKMGINQAGARQAVSPEAYQEFLLGRAAAAKDSLADLHEAADHFERAVALEPKYTAAWVQLARAHTQLGRWGGTPTLQAWRAARDAIDHARALETDSPEMLLALGWILRTSDWDWRGAERAFRRSIELGPNQPDAMAGLAVLLFNIGKTDEAFRLGQQAARLDPLNAATQIDLSIMFYLSYNWAEAERAARRALQLAPGGTSYHSVLSWSLISQHRYAEAEAEAAQDTDEVEKPTALGFLAIARGQGAAAREQLARLENLSSTRGDSADLQQSIAWLSANLGEKDRAFAALEKARATRDPSMSWLRNSWYLKPLYSDPRWSVLLHQVGLADDQLK